MIIKQKLGTLNEFDTGNRIVDRLPLEWYETSKRILNKKTVGGKEVFLKFLSANSGLQQDDVVYADEHLIVVIDILACDVIEVQPATMYAMACLCYEIGNKHLPLFYENGSILVPFETPLFRLLSAGGFEPVQSKRKLLHALKTTIVPHDHVAGNSLFARIMQITT
jgi:urease accessory protein